MTVGTFACILAMRRGGKSVESVTDLAGLAKTHPIMAFVLAMLMFSLAGIPPLAGFFAKLYVFLAAVQAGLFTLAVIGLVASVVGAFYYLRIVKLMYFDEVVGEPIEPVAFELKAVLGVSGLFTLVFVAFGEGLVVAAGFAAKTFF
jgi:NADH-quinone oxidoreductase subunit N